MFTDIVKHQNVWEMTGIFEEDTLFIAHKDLREKL
jgi:hypothetical protein